MHVNFDRILKLNVYENYVLLQFPLMGLRSEGFIARSRFNVAKHEKMYIDKQHVFVLFVLIHLFFFNTRSNEGPQTSTIGHAF